MKKKLLALFLTLLLLSASLMPVAAVAAFAAAGDVEVILHYYRYADDYDTWTVWSWVSGAEGQSFELVRPTDSSDSYGGRIARFTLSNAAGKDIGFIIRRGEWAEKDVDDDRFIPASLTASGKAEFWLLQADTTIYFNPADVDKSPRITTATIEKANQIVANVTTPLDANVVFRVEDMQQNIIPISLTEFSAGDRSAVLNLSKDLDFTKLYRVYATGYKEAIAIFGGAYSTPEFEALFTYTGDDLGAVYAPSETRFRLWAPTAGAVTLNLFPTGNDSAATKTVTMTADVNGTWTAKVSGDLNKTYYTYTVTVAGVEREAVDPYARAVGVNGKRGMVIDLSKTNPTGFTAHSAPVFSLKETIIYEAHIRDLTIDPSSGVKEEWRGKYLGLTQKGTKTASGKSTALDYLSALGINTVHLLPAFDYRSIDETNSANAFNWGYDPQNYNVPEGSYSTDPYHGEVRINEFKQMVQSLHGAGLKVVMDVVYNHTGATADSDFNKIVPYYYYRMVGGKFSNGSGCGNETASERAMMRKFIVDSLKYWVTEYKIDGFRFDLMGLHDITTMNMIRDALQEINPAIILYGEGWDAADSGLDFASAAKKMNMKQLPGIAAFSDNIRDGIKGFVFNAQGRGFINGGIESEETLKFGIVGGVYNSGVNIAQVKYNDQQIFWAGSPLQSITYASAHDNYTLWDKLAISAPEATLEQRLAMNRMSALIVYTSQGIPFMLCGEEILRSKPNQDGTLNENSYNSSDYTNAIRWDNLDKAEYAAMLDYYKGIIAFRKAHPDLIFETAAQVESGIKFLKTSANYVGYSITSLGGETYRVYLNGTKSTVRVSLPGKWEVYASGATASAESYQTISGSYRLAANESLIVRQISGGISTGALIAIIGGAVVLLGCGAAFVCVRTGVFKKKEKE